MPGPAYLAGGQRLENLAMLGKAPGSVLAVDQVAVDLHVEDAAPAFDELGLNVELVFDRFRQTGGLGQVVSISAVSDGDVHFAFSRMLSRRYYTRPAAGFHAGPGRDRHPACGPGRQDSPF